MRSLRSAALGRGLPRQRGPLSVAPRALRRAHWRGGEPALPTWRRDLAGGPRGVAGPDGRAPGADGGPGGDQERALLGADRRRRGGGRRLRGGPPPGRVRRTDPLRCEGPRGLADRPPQRVEGRAGGYGTGRLAPDSRCRLL